MVWAIGECGLDKYSQVDFDIQKQYFIKQIELSELTHKPLIIHCVKAYNELLNLKKLQAYSTLAYPWVPKEQKCRRATY